MFRINVDLKVHLSSGGSAPEGMVWIPGGEFSMGSDVTGESLCGSPGVTRDALPVHQVYVDGFWMDQTDVTNEKFEKFVNATGYITVAERPPTKEEYPTAPPENLVAGSVVFTPPDRPVELNDHYQWWNYVKGEISTGSNHVGFRCVQWAAERKPL